MKNSHHSVDAISEIKLGAYLDRGDGICDTFQHLLMKHNRTFKLADIKMTVAALDTLSRYVSPINPAVFPHLTLVLLGIGLFFTAWFFVYEVGNYISETRTISKKFLTR